MAIDLSALRAVKLRETEIERDASAPKLTTERKEDLAAAAEEEKTRRAYFFDTGLDRWVDELPDITFPTRFVPLARAEAEAIVGWYAERGGRGEPGPGGEEEAAGWPAELNAVADKLDAVICGVFGGAGFVKLSTRSPKDSTVALAAAQAAFKATERLPELDLHQRLQLLNELTLRSLRVESGREAVQHLVHSERVWEDLTYALEMDGELDGIVCLVCRAWQDIPLSAEWRGFVWDGQLTACGQYYHPLHFPELEAVMEAVQSDIVAMWQAVGSKLGHDHCIVDFVWTAPGEVLIVEVNPFDGVLGSFPASTGLFNWEADGDIMRSTPTTWRYRREPMDEADVRFSIRTTWRDIVYQGLSTPSA